MASVVINGDTSGAVTISAPAVAGTTTLTLPTTSGTILQSGTAVTEAQGGTGTTTGYYGFKNRIINGAMVIDQRNAGASVAMTGGIYITDRWRSYASAAYKLTAQQSSTASTGFSNSLLFTSQSAYTQSATDEFLVEQRIEGFNTSDLAWGTANAQTVTLSFWVRSSLTGTFSGALSNSAQDRNYPFTFTISTANTFEYKSVTIAGDTSGTWIGSTNGIGIRVKFNLGTGSTYLQTAGAWTASYANGATGSVALVNTNTATFYITGIQLEKGSTATSFDYRPYTNELILCQRYFWKIGGTSISEQIAMGLVQSSTVASCITSFPVAMRAAPSLGYSSASAFAINDAAVQVATTAVSISLAGLQTTGIDATVASGLTLGRAVRFFTNSSISAYINFSAEL